VSGKASTLVQHLLRLHAIPSSVDGATSPHVCAALPALGPPHACLLADEHGLLHLLHCSWSDPGASTGANMDLSKLPGGLLTA
jgi:hypothetical protein